MPLALTTLTWRISRIGIAGFSTWPSLAFSPSGTPAVAFHSSTYKALRFATLDAAGAWAVSEVDSLNSDCRPSLKYRFGQPAISYGLLQYPGGDTANPVRGMNYAISRGGTPAWTIAKIGPEGFDSSLAFDGSKRPCVSFQDHEHALRYAYSPNPSVWVSMAVDGPAAGSFNALAFAPSGHPAIVYTMRPAGGGPEQIKYAEFDGADWHIEVVGTGAGWCSLAFSTGGEPMVAYVDARGTASNVIVATRTGGAWQREVLAAQADSPSLAVSPAGTPAVSYHDVAGASVKYAALIDRQWQHFLVEQTGKDAQGVWTGDFTLTSLAFSPAGDPAISYFDRQTGEIKCAIGAVTMGVRGWDVLGGVLDSTRTNG